MNNTYLQTDLERETKNFKAFASLTVALTLIDKYQSSIYKDQSLLTKAATFISEAVKADEGYFKARYFEAVVNFLQGNNKAAIGIFKNLNESNPTSDVRNEIQYNLAVANYNIALTGGKPGSFADAIKEFRKVADKTVDPETKLLARAGLALSYAKQNEYLRKVERLEEIEANASEITAQHEQIQKTLASTQERKISDEVVEQVKSIMVQALKENVKLPRRRRRKLTRLLRRHRFILALLAAATILWALILYLYFYWGV